MAIESKGEVKALIGPFMKFLLYFLLQNIKVVGLLCILDH